jgi:hypothetical protein
MDKARGWNEAFLDRVRNLGHDLKTLAETGEHAMVKRVANLEELRELLGPRSEEERQGYMASVEGTAPESTDLVSAARRYISGTGTLSEEQAKELSTHMPMDVQLLAANDKTLEENEEWVIESGAPQVISLRTLIMKKGSRITVRRTHLKMSCEVLDRES